MDKTVATLADATKDIFDGATIMIGGFGGSGAPIELIHAVVDRYRSTGHPKSLTVVNNNAGNGAVGIAAMIDAGMVAKMICSFPKTADPRAFTDKYFAGEIELDLVPQGTLAERIRAAGAGIPAFYTPTAVGTQLAKGKPTLEVDGKTYLRESWLPADFALIKADKSDMMGNLTYRRAARNFNPLMCMAAEISIVQSGVVEEAGVLEPDHVVTPGIFVARVVHVPDAKQEEDLIREGVNYS